MEFTAKQIAELIEGRIEGDENAKVSSFAKIEEGREGAISFLSNPKYTHFLYDTKSSVVLINEDVVLEKPVAPTLIRVKNAYESVARLLQIYDSMKPKKTGVDALAFVSPSATIGKDVYIGPFCYIGDGVVIGDGTRIFPNVTIYDGTRIGQHVTIHAGAVIGADGFGFAPNQEGYEKIPQIGIVIIEDDVEIGANSCVDRAMMGSTVVHRNVKIDNLVQIAHNVEVGESTFLCAQVGIAGSSKVGKHCILTGQVGVAGHIEIADNCIFGAQAGVAGSVRKPGMYQGTPAIEAGNWRRSSVGFKQLPDIRKRLQAVEKK